MSLGSGAINVNPIQSVYVPYGASNVSFSLATISSLTTNNITLDTVTLDCSSANGGQLLINNVPVATVNQNVSSITNWSSYPAVSTITYSGNGGTANLAAINALTSMSTPQMFASTINGFSFPTAAFPPVISTAGGAITNGANYNINFNGQAPGFYLLTVNIQTGTGTDPMSCSCVVRFYGGAVLGGCLHAPAVGGAAPSFANCVSIQDNTASDTNISVFVYSNSNTIGLGIIPQFAVYRLT